MRKICYHVAVSLDGFIPRRDGSTEGFPPEGDHVEEYLERSTATRCYYHGTEDL